MPGRATRIICNHIFIAVSGFRTSCAMVAVSRPKAVSRSRSSRWTRMRSNSARARESSMTDAPLNSSPPGGDVGRGGWELVMSLGLGAAVPQVMRAIVENPYRNRLLGISLKTWPSRRRMRPPAGAARPLRGHRHRARAVRPASVSFPTDHQLPDGRRGAGRQAAPPRSSRRTSGLRAHRAARRVWRASCYGAVGLRGPRVHSCPTGVP